MRTPSRLLQALSVTLAALAMVIAPAAPAGAGQVTIRAASTGEPDPESLARARLLIARYGALSAAGVEFELVIDPAHPSAARVSEFIRESLEAHDAPAWLFTRAQPAQHRDMIARLDMRSSLAGAPRACPFQLAISEQMIFDDGQARLLLPAPPSGASLPLPMRGSLVSVTPARAGLARPDLVMETAQGFSVADPARITSADAAFGAWARAHVFWDLTGPLPDLARVEPETAVQRLSGLTARFAPAGPWSGSRRDLFLPLPQSVEAAGRDDGGYCYIDFRLPAR